MVVLRLEVADSEKNAQSRWCRDPAPRVAPQDETSNRSAKDDPEATDELKDAIYARVILYAIQFRYGRGQQCVVAAREDAVEYDEDDKSLTVRVEPEGEYGDGGQDDLKWFVLLYQHTASE